MVKEPSIPANEQARLRALAALDVLDTPAEERFDRITRLAADHFSVPISLVSLVDVNRQWFKSCHGLDARETPRQISFCGHAILAPDVFCIEDAASHPDFADNPLVAGPPGIRFYAGAPLSLDGTDRLGTLCIIDRKPRAFPAKDRHTLRMMADWVQRELLFTNMVSLTRMMERERAFKSAFVATVSHELRTPVTAMLGALDILNHQHRDDLGESGQVWLDMAVKNAQSMSRLVNDILDIEQIGQDMLKLEIRPVAARTLAEDAVALYRPYGEARGVGVQLANTLDPNCLVAVDPDRFQQIMANLLSNAFKFSPEGATVTVRVRAVAGSLAAEASRAEAARTQTGAEPDAPASRLQSDAPGSVADDESARTQVVLVEIEDQGPGIPADDLDRIFEKFYQTRISARQDVPGTGLGLAITRSLAERMGIQITVCSELGRGACFSLHIPVLTQSLPTQDTPSGSSQGDLKQRVARECDPGGEEIARPPPRIQGAG